MPLKILFFVLTSVAIITSSIASAFAGNDPEKLSLLHNAALEYARMQPSELSSLKKRTRRAAMLPQLQIGTKRSIQNNVNIAVGDNVSVTSTGSTIGPTTSDIKQAAGGDTSIEVKAVWQLSEIIFNDDMIDVATEARYQMRERRTLLEEVNRLYFERERSLASLKSIAKLRSKKAEAALLKIKAEECEAGLDALTGGYFSRSFMPN